MWGHGRGRGAASELRGWMRPACMRGQRVGPLSWGCTHAPLVGHHHRLDAAPVPPPCRCTGGSDGSAAPRPIASPVPTLPLTVRIPALCPTPLMSSHAQVMEEIIAKSRMYRALKAQQREEDEAALEALNTQFKELVRSAALSKLVKPPGEGK